jgi:anti-sigma factor RsiW
MANMDCKIAVAWMHEYLDGDLGRKQAEMLREHTGRCEACRARLDALANTEAFIRGMPSVKTPENLEARILASLPKPRRSSAKWLRRHPAVSAAALFLVVMFSSFITMWNQDKQLSVSGPDLENVEIQGTTVIVPAGKQVSGDLTIVNGSAEVLGEVKGDLTVIDGKVMLASTAHIAGNVEKIDRAVDWAWYKIRSWFGTLAYGT